MPTEEERKQKIRKAFFQYAQENDMPDINTMSYYSRQFLPDESFFMKRQVLNELIESGIMVSRNGKWLIKKLSGED
jgi:hypothetical protein